MSIKRGTLSKGGKPTKFTVLLYLNYFELGGKITDKKINPIIATKLQEMMGWEDNSGILCLNWGLENDSKNSTKNNNYHFVMKEARDIAWMIYSKCA